MGGYEDLKTAITALIHTNDNQEITGATLQSALLSIINTIGQGSVFKGVATTSTNPGSPDANVFYIAGRPGYYPNFNLELAAGLHVIENKSGTWVNTEIALDVVEAINIGGAKHVKPSQAMLINLQSIEQIPDTEGLANKMWWSTDGHLKYRHNDTVYDLGNPGYVLYYSGDKIYKWTGSGFREMGSGGTFASGEAVSNMSVFNDGSDTDGKSSAQLAAMIPSGEVIRSLLEIISSIETSGGSYDGVDLITTFSYDAPTRVITVKQSGRQAKTILLPLANSTNAGLMSSEDKTQLANMQNLIGKTVNSFSKSTGETGITITLVTSNGTPYAVLIPIVSSSEPGLVTPEVIQQINNKANLVKAGNLAGNMLDMDEWPRTVISNISNEDMPSELNPGDVYFIPYRQQGSTIRPASLWIYVDDTNDISLGVPTDKVVYCHKTTGNLYIWDSANNEFAQVGGSNIDPSTLASKADKLLDSDILTPSQWPHVMIYNIESMWGAGGTPPDYASIPVGSIYLDDSSGIDDPPYRRLFYKKTLEGTSQRIDLGAPQENTIYCHIATGKLYRWVPTQNGNDGAFTQIGTGSDVEVVDNLNSDDGAKALSAKQGKVLDGKIGNKANASDVYDKSQTYTKGEVDAAVASGGKVKTVTINGTTSQPDNAGDVDLGTIEGEPGADGITPHIGENGHWYIGATDTDVPAQGPKGNSVVDGDTFDIVNNLHEGGEGDALSAEQGKMLGEAVFNYEMLTIDVTTPSLTNVYINTNNAWAVSGSAKYKGKFINIEQYRGCKFKIGNFKFDSNGAYFCRFALLTSDSHTSGNAPDYSAVSPFTTLINVNASDATIQWYEGVIPNDAKYIYIYCYSYDNNGSHDQNMIPEFYVTNPVPSNRIERLEDLTGGIDEIKEGWFAVSGEPYDYSVPLSLIGRQQSIGTGTYAGKIYTGSSAPVAALVPKAVNPVNGNIYYPSASERFNVDDLPNKLLTLMFQQVASPARWAAYVVLYDSNANFLERSEILYFDTSNNFTNSYDFATKATAKYFVLIIYYQSDGSSSDNALNVNYVEGFCQFSKQVAAQESMPERVAALEAGIEELKGAAISKFRIAAWNVGHFALGASYKTSINTQEAYEEMRTKWRTKLNGMSPDVLVMCEYSTVFADLATDVEAKDAIFSQYAYRAIGSTPSSTSYMQTAQYSNIPIKNVAEVVYAQTVQAGRYYQVSDLVLGGVTVKLVITHLDFDQGDNGATYRASQIQTLLDAFANESHVIICGDFNNKLASEWDVFANAGYVMANHGYLGDISTYPAGAATKAIDNIIAKGFALTNISIIDDATLTDHAALMCDLTLID